METSLKYKNGMPFFLILALLAVITSSLYYFIDFYPSVINFNEFWLYTCSARILAGEKMSLGCFDSNPPLSVLLYVPSVLITQYFSIPVHISLFIYSLFALCISTLSIFLILKNLKIIDSIQIAVLLYAYFISNLLLTGLFLGERDHFVLFALVPFVLLQISITNKTYSDHAGSFIVMILCVFFLLIKPHYGLIPLAFIIWRIKSEKAKLKDIFFWRDVQAAIFTLILYTLCIITFFPDFISEILFTSVKLYVISHREFTLYDLFTQLLIINLLSISILFICKNNLKENKILLPFALLSFLCLFPFLLQFKGTPYQAIPPKITLFCFCSLLAYQLLEQKISKLSTGLICCLLITVFCITFKPINSQTPTHQIYSEHPLTKIIKKNKAHQNQCDFFIFEGMKAVQILSYYSDCNLSSRFPVLWFFPTLLSEEEKLSQNKKSILTQEEILAYKKKFAKKILEDLKKNPPTTLILAESFVFTEHGDFFSLEKFMLEYEPDFQEFWKNYTVQEKIEFSFPDIMKGTTFETPKTIQSYKIYVRK